MRVGALAKTPFPDLKIGHVDHLLFLSVFSIFLEHFMLISKFL